METPWVTFNFTRVSRWSPEFSKKLYKGRKSGRHNVPKRLSKGERRQVWKETNSLPTFLRLALLPCLLF